MKFIKWLDEHLEEVFLVIFLVLISVVCLLQVIARRIPTLNVPWTDEFCRFMWIWSVFVSVPYTIRKGSMLRVSVVLDLLPEALRKVINIVVDLIIVASMALLTYYSVSVLQGIISSGELSPAMRWPMSTMYTVMLVCYALSALRGVQQAIIHITHFGQRELTTLEQTMADAAAEAEAGKRAEGGET